MQYTLRNVPKAVDRALRQRARRENKSLNAVAVEALSQGAGIAEHPVKRRELADLAGCWKEDAEFDAAIADQHQIDPELWR